MKRVLGIEGGGTKTEWLLVDEAGEMIRHGVLSGANMRLVSDEALERLFRVLEFAGSDPVAPVSPSHVGVFLAGCANEADHARLLGIARRVWPGAALTVGSDRQSGFAAAFGGGDGVAVIAGTGSAITGRRGEQIEKASGWGQLLGDTGSGYDLAMRALRALLWKYDLTRQVTPVAERVLAMLSLNVLGDLVSWVKDADKMSVARLAPVVFEAAAEGDSEMRAILEAGAGDLAEGACAVARRLGLEAPEVCLQGGLFTNRADYAECFTRRMAELLPGARVRVCTESGARGAVWLASREAERGMMPLASSASESSAELEELGDALTEQVNPRSVGLEGMTTPEIVDLFIREEAQVQAALERARLPMIAAIELTTDALRQGGRLFYVGAGTSGRLGVLDASEIPPTFGTDPGLVQGIMAGGVAALYRAVEGAEDQAEGGALAVRERGVHRGDVVCGIAASGRTPFVLGALEEARKLGARTILLSCNPPRKRGAIPWDVEVDLSTGPELLTGSTRLKAGTATKCALNLLSTGTMVRLGKVSGNLMACFVVSNAKLRERAIRMVSRVRGLSREEAEALLEAHAWEVRRCLSPG